MSSPPTIVSSAMAAPTLPYPGDLPSAVAQQDPGTAEKPPVL